MSKLVFGIGLPQTGNQRLAEHLRQQGYKPREGANWSSAVALEYLSRGEQRILVDCLRDGYDSWTGWPFVCYRKLFARYPEAKYVLTVCGSLAEWTERWGKWRESVLETKDPGMAMSMPLLSATLAHVFGDENPSLGHAADVYERHNAAVEKFMQESGAKEFVVLNLDSRRAERVLNRFLPPKEGTG